MAATASPNLADQALLSADPVFINRVQEALIATCNNIVNESITGLTGTMPLQLHLLRARQANAIMQNIGGGSPSWAQKFAGAVATDATTISAATVNGTTPLTAGNAATQAAVIPDTAIVNAISAAFNTFLTLS
jgi:hypothetical protein